MIEFSDEEKEFWANVSLDSALMDILTPEVVEAMVAARIPNSVIINLAAMHCFTYPNELGVRRHADRIRNIILHMQDGGFLD